MQRVVRRSLQRQSFLSHLRHGFSAQPNYAPYYDIQEEVVVEGRANSRAAVLNRPSALNSSMAARLKRLYESWEETPDIGLVIMKGKGRASVVVQMLLPFTNCLMKERKMRWQSYDEWCTTALKKLKEASPLSLKVTLQSIREGRFQSLDRCLVREYCLSLNWISKHVSNDLCEGVRARLVDKDFAPKLEPASLQEVTKDMVDYYSSPFSELEPELDLPTALREPSV